jgi:hypothetical protein
MFFARASSVSSVIPVFACNHHDARERFGSRIFRHSILTDALLLATALSFLLSLKHATASPGFMVNLTVEHGCLFVNEQFLRFGPEHANRAVGFAKVCRQHRIIVQLQRLG